MSITQRVKAAWTALVSSDKDDADLRSDVALLPAVVERPNTSLERAEQQIERAATTTAPSQQNAVMQVVRSWVPPRRGTAELAAAYREMPWLRAVIGRRGDAVASVQFQVYRKKKSAGDVTGRLSSARMLRGCVDEVLRAAIKAGELELVVENPLLDLLNNPCPLFGRRETWKLAIKYIDLVGECFFLKERNVFGKVVELTPIPPHWVRRIPTSLDDTFFIQHNQLTISVPSSDLIYIRDVDLYNPYERGTGIAFAAADELQADEAAAKAALSRYFNNNVPDVIITFPRADQTVIKRLEAEWNSKTQGPERRGKAIFGGEAPNVQKIGNTLQEDDYVEMRKMHRDFIMQLFGMPPETLGIIENSNRSTIDAAAVLLAQYVVIPHMERLCDVLNAQLAPEFGDDLVIGYENPVPDDARFQLDVMKASVAAFTVNDYRKLAGQSQLADGDIFIAPATGYVAVSSPMRVQPVNTSAKPTNNAPVNAPRLPAVAEKSSAPSKSRTTPKETTKAIQQRNLKGGVLANAILMAINIDLMWVLLEPIFLDILTDFGVNRAAQLGGDLAIDDPVLQGIMKKERDRFSELINATTRDEIAAALEPALGLPVAEQKQIVIDYFKSDAMKARQATIAATEVVVSSERAALRAYNNAGILEKQWISTPDSRVRDSHRTMNGQRVSILAPYTLKTGPNAARQAQTPATFGIPAEDIYCRCVSAPVVNRDRAIVLGVKSFCVRAEDSADDQKITQKQIWEETEQKRKQYESKLITAVEDGMEAQMNALLESL